MCDPTCVLAFKMKTNNEHTRLQRKNRQEIEQDTFWKLLSSSKLAMNRSVGQISLSFFVVQRVNLEKRFLWLSHCDKPLLGKMSSSFLIFLRFSATKNVSVWLSSFCAACLAD